jgi:hypothetical protein
MMNKSYITIPFFKSRVHLVRLDHAKDYILQHFRGIDAYDAPPDAVTCAYVDMIEGKARNYFIMALPKKYDACTVVHESVHMAWFLLDYCQVELSRDNHEMLPMLVEELYRKASMKMYKVKV